MSVLMQTYLTIGFNVMEIITSLFNIFRKFRWWSSSTLAVITDKNFTSWFQPLVEGSEQCRFVLKINQQPQTLERESSRKPITTVCIEHRRGKSLYAVRLAKLRIIRSTRSNKCLKSCNRASHSQHHCNKGHMILKSRFNHCLQIQKHAYVYVFW